MLRALTLLLCLFLTACQTQPRFRVEPLPHYDAAFEHTSGWTGGDGAYSAGLGRERVLWMFGDTLVGRVQNGRRVRLPSDQQLGRDSNRPRAIRCGPGVYLSHALRRRPGGVPATGGRLGWLWPYHGVRTTEGLFLFLLQIEPADGPAAFGFRLVATWLGKVADPDAPPERWTVSWQKIPWGHERRLFGSSVLLGGDHV